MRPKKLYGCSGDCRRKPLHENKGVATTANMMLTTLRRRSHVVAYWHRIRGRVMFHWQLWARWSPIRCSSFLLAFKKTGNNNNTDKNKNKQRRTFVVVVAYGRVAVWYWGCQLDRACFWRCLTEWPRQNLELQFLAYACFAWALFY